MSSSSRMRVSSRKTATPASLTIPLPSTPILGQVCSSPRRRRARLMPLRDPGHCGLFTVSEADEEDATAEAGPSARSSWLSMMSSSPRSVAASSIALLTPGSENEDPFGNADWAMDVEEYEYDASPRKGAPLRNTRRPTPIEVDPYTVPSRGVLPPRSPRSPLMARLPRISTSSALSLPRTPTRARRQVLLPPLPILSHGEFTASRRCDSPPSPMPTTPVTPQHERVHDVNLVSALRDLLTSCGEYDVCDASIFADADEGQDGQFCDAPEDPTTPLGTYTTLVPWAPAGRRAQRSPTQASFVGDHSFLQSLSNSPVPDDDDCDSLRSMPSMPSLSSCSSLSSADSSLSLASLASQTEPTTISYTPTASPAASPSPAPKRPSPRVSSRRTPPRAPLPVTWTGYI